MKAKLNKRLSFIIIILVLVILLIVNLYIIIDYKNNYEEYLEYKSTIFDNSISQVFHTYEQFSNFVYETEVNTAEVKDLFFRAEKAGPRERDILRNELYVHFEELYALLTTYNFRQLHFHFKDGESFLRVHYPERYGDNLLSIRESVRIVNEEERFVSGFEEGRIYNGYRYVYPMNYLGKHIGSVEVSISVESVLRDLYEFNTIKRDIGFLIEKKIVEETVFEETQGNYRTSFISEDYYTDLAAFEIMKNSESSLKIYTDDKFIEKLREETKEELQSGESFSKAIKHEDVFYLVQLCAISNVAGEKVGYFISISQDEQIETMKKNNTRWILFSIAIMMITISMAAFLIKKQLEVQKIAMVDQLTKIYNRRFFFEVSEKELRKSIRDQSEIFVAMVDIDHFKMVNDTYGHLVGDSVLASLAKLVQESIRSKDIFARYGGEEFILLMPQTKKNEAEIMLKRIRDKVETYNFSPVERLTISIGFASVDVAKGLEKSIDWADDALYVAKNSGRNKVVEYMNN